MFGEHYFLFCLVPPIFPSPTYSHPGVHYFGLALSREMKYAVELEYGLEQGKIGVRERDQLRDWENISRPELR